MGYSWSKLKLQNSTRVCVPDISGNCKTEYLIKHSIAKSITVILLYHLFPGSASYAGKPVKSTVIFLWCGFVF